MTAVGHFLHAAEPYIFQGILGVIALFGLWKDWKDYGDASGRFKKPVRTVLLIGTLIVILLSAFDTYDTRRDARLKEQTASWKEVESKKQIDDLTTQVRLGREENKDNADGFRTSFANLYNKYSQLAARVQNADLLREIAQTRKELKATQDKLNQPKAHLAASFWYPNFSVDNIQQEVTTPKRADGSVTFDIVVMNPEDVPALNGSFTIRICETCRFSKEPKGSMHLEGSDERDRQWSFDRILPKSAVQKYEIEVTPHNPLLGNRFEVDMLYACVNCVGGKQVLWVNIQ